MTDNGGFTFVSIVLGISKPFQKLSSRLRGKRTMLEEVKLEKSIS